MHPAAILEVAAVIIRLLNEVGYSDWLRCIRKDVAWCSNGLLIYIYIYNTTSQSFQRCCTYLIMSVAKIVTLYRVTACDGRLRIGGHSESAASCTESDTWFRQTV